MDNIIGPPVTGDDFFGRHDELKYGWKLIESGNNLILPSPRRVGKTSFALKLIDKAEKAGWKTIKINLEKRPTELDFIETLIDEFKKLKWWRKVKKKGKDLVEFINQFRPAFTHGDITIHMQWQSVKKDVYKEIAELLDHSQKTLIFFDEFTVLLNSIMKGPGGKDDVTAFLHWLRSMRIVAPSKIRWIYCSSVGIENFTYRHGISDSVNDFSDLKLKAYSKEESIEMLVKLGHDNKLPLPGAVLQAIVDKLEYCLPYFLQITFGKIDYMANVEHLSVDSGIVDAAYNALIEEKHFDTWVERIKEQYGLDESYAFAFLKHICQAKAGTRRDNLMGILVGTGVDIDRAEDITSRLLYMLQNDGYLISEGELYRFRSPLLRDFWFNRFVK